MRTWRSPVLLWVLCSILWGVVIIDTSVGNGADAMVSVIHEKRDLVEPIVSDSAEQFDAGEASLSNRCIDINSASTDQLVALPGIGPVLAARIADFRRKNGPFLRLTDLDKVHGIGPATLRKLEKKVCF